MKIEPKDSVQRCVENAGVLMSNAVDNLELARDPRIPSKQQIFIAAAHAQAQLAAALELRVRRMLDTKAGVWSTKPPQPTVTPERCDARMWQELGWPRESQPRCVKVYEHKGDHVFDIAKPPQPTEPKPPAKNYRWEPNADETVLNWMYRVAGYFREIAEGK